MKSKQKNSNRSHKRNRDGFKAFMGIQQKELARQRGRAMDKLMALAKAEKAESAVE